MKKLTLLLMVGLCAVALALPRTMEPPATLPLPSGVPVAGVAIGGAKNAALLAAQILGLKHDKIKAAYEEYRKKFAQGSYQG